MLGRFKPENYFQANYPPRIFDMWLELVALVDGNKLVDEEDCHIRMFHPSGQYTVKSFYVVINNYGVVPLHTPAVWRLHIPPRIHVFLWLLANDKILTRINFSRQRQVDDTTYLFCSEVETAQHLFCECVVAKIIWETISDILEIQIGSDFESIARWWISEDRNSVINVISSATLWSIWTIRNAMCFQGLRWPGVKVLLQRTSAFIRSWRVLCLDKHSSLSRLPHLRREWVPSWLCVAMTPVRCESDRWGLRARAVCVRSGYMSQGVVCV